MRPANSSQRPEEVVDLQVILGESGTAIELHIEVCLRNSPTVGRGGEVILGLIRRFLVVIVCEANVGPDFHVGVLEVRIRNGLDGNSQRVGQRQGFLHVLAAAVILAAAGSRTGAVGGKAAAMTVDTAAPICR